jgi:putative transposase
VHYDPYDVTRVWVRNHHDGGWITVPWTHLKMAPIPFGEQAWAQAQQILARRGADPANEAEIAGAVAALLDRAEHGPDAPAKPASTKRDRRVAARTRATATPAGPRPAEAADDDPPVAPIAPDAPDADTTAEDGLAPVIPLGVFDARDEAKRWW